jgi:hypothetical protein
MLILVLRISATLLFQYIFQECQPDWDLETFTVFHSQVPNILLAREQANISTTSSTGQQDQFYVKSTIDTGVPFNLHN